MKKGKVLIMFFAVLFSAASSSSLFAQEKAAAASGKIVKKFDEANRKLNADDISFLTAISGAKTRGTSKDVTLNGKKYSEGQTLTGTEGKDLEKAANDYTKAHPSAKKVDKSASPDKNRGGCCYCCPWYDAYGNLWWLWCC